MKEELGRLIMEEENVLACVRTEPADVLVLVSSARGVCETSRIVHLAASGKKSGAFARVYGHFIRLQRREH